MRYSSLFAIGFALTACGRSDLEFVAPPDTQVDSPANVAVDTGFAPLSDSATETAMDSETAADSNLFVDSRPDTFAETDSSSDTNPYGEIWNDIEASGNCHGTWTRIGQTHVFSAVWSDCKVTATLDITITGLQVSIVRTESSDGNNCTYQGTLSADGLSVAGTYSCTLNPPSNPNWNATIEP